jgi:transcriptional regulator with XRE-family HTH domain
MSLDRDQKRFVALGRQLFCDDWHGKFARMCGISRPYVSRIATGNRPVTDEVRAKVIAGLRAEVERHRARAINVLELLREYEK